MLTNFFNPGNIITNCTYANMSEFNIKAHAGPAFAHGTTGAKRTVGAPTPYIKICKKKNAKLCNIVTATSLLN
jgi:hypothetical protein